jgi:NO-binding membrane sensor protein with MHYT domain/CheY-like chemotaxis protein
MLPTYSPWLVLASILVASLASYTALDLASRIAASRGAAARAWLVGGAISMGTGIWSMHFIGMLAVRLPIPLGYEWGATIASLLFAICSSFFALYIVTSAALTPARLAVSGTIMGLGIASMHYVGMAALDMRPAISYDLLLVALSIAIAIGASTAALWAAYELRRDSRWARHGRLGSALIMGLAIYGMHYTAMAAANFAPGSVCVSSSLVDTPLLAGSVTAFTVFLLCTTLLLSLIDARMTARTVELASAQEANRAKDQFLAMLGHELRNPLAAITNAIHLLDHQGPGREESFTFARGVISRQTAHLTRLIDDLLDVSRVISGKVVLSLEPLDLNESLQHALSALHASGRSRNHEVRQSGSAAWLLGDRTRIEQVITNLLVNAATYTPDGGRIEARVEREGGDAVLVVSDSGVGIAPAALPQVFDLFFQSGQEVHRTTGGLGIGLTLVKRLVEIHGGTVKVESAGIGRGTRVTVRYPAIKAPAAQPAAQPSRDARGARDVAIVEDETDVREALRKVLELAGHRVHTAGDGVSGLEKIRSRRPDVAILDIGLPGISGYEIARRLREDHVRVFLIALSGYSSQEDRQRALSAGFDAHLAKPADMAELSGLIAGAPGAHGG